MTKNKIVFAGVLLCILLFLIAYGYWAYEDTPSQPALTAPELPNWEGADAPFETKMEALDALKEARPTTPTPSPYPDHMIDEKGYFNPDYMEYEKHRIIDSIYAREAFLREATTGPTHAVAASPGEETPTQSPAPTITTPELTLEHQLFFASHPEGSKPGEHVRARITGNQTLRISSRVRLQTRASLNKGNTQADASILWGTVSFGPNRVFIAVKHPEDPSLILEAYDLQDGLRGIYLENTFKAQAGSEVLQDVIQDVNIAGLPQLDGIKNVFRRHQRNIKVTVLDGHSLVLKPKSSSL